MPGRVPLAAALAVSATACAVLVAATTGADGLLQHPYRTAAWSDATTADRWRPARWRRCTSTRRTAAPVRRDQRPRATRSAGDPVMAFDEMAGVVLLLDGRSVGEAWYSRIDPARTAAGIRASAPAHAPGAATLPSSSTTATPEHRRPGRSACLRALAARRLQTGDGRRPENRTCGSTSRPAPREGRDHDRRPSRAGGRHAGWSRSSMPALNELDNVPAVLRADGRPRRRRTPTYDFELVLVDDGSRRHRRARHGRRTRRGARSRSCSSPAASGRTRRSPPACGAARATARSCSVPTSRSRRS